MLEGKRFTKNDEPKHNVHSDPEDLGEELNVYINASHLFKLGCLLCMLLQVATFSSCKYFKKTALTDERPVAKVNEAILYYDDIEAVVKSAGGRKDSADIVRQYIEDWVKRKLMIQKAIVYLPADRVEIEKQVNDYRESLILYAYEKELILQKTDTFFSREELLNYYDNYSINFELAKDVAQIHFVKIPRESPKLDSVSIWFSSEREDHSLKLRDYCYQYATDFSFADTIWYEVDVICRNVPVSPEQVSNYYRNRNSAAVTDSMYYYLLKVNNFRNKGEISPFDFVKPDIERILLNNRKVDLVRSTYETIYQEALRNKEFEIYP